MRINRHYVLLGLLVVLLLASACTMPVQPSPAQPTPAAADALPAASGLPPADIAVDEGGVVSVTGEASFNPLVVSTFYHEPSVALIDVGRRIQGDRTEFAPGTSQILGALTSAMDAQPATFAVALPIEPAAPGVDLDNDGQKDAGVQVYAATIAPNDVGNSYLDQIEQLWENSILTDPTTGMVREGALLIYVPDDAQGFPSAAGSDGVFFTADDPAVALPAGYTVATLGADGSVTFDRSRRGQMDILEPAEVALSDFSGQGITESFNSLIDLLAVRYAYTDLRKLDWEQIRRTYLPRVEEADAAGDMAAYYVVLSDLALSIRDAHVQVGATASNLKEALISSQSADATGNLGAQLVELDDGRFIITYLDPTGPGAQAGWQFGAEIVSVDGAPMSERVASRPVFASVATEKHRRLAQLSTALSFPAGASVAVEYRQPGESDPQSVTLTASADASLAPAPAPREDISFKALDGGYGYIQWSQFLDANYKMAVWEKFLRQFNKAPGIVIDLRGNGGGSVALFLTMASYFFTAEAPAPMHWTDDYIFDDVANTLVESASDDYVLSAPAPDLAYTGPVAVLVDENSASAAEYMPQFLQRNGRGTVVGEHGTEGAGGYAERVLMPGTITFQYTKGRTFFAGTDELNLEAKGVTLDVRVPITEENERAKLDGGDPVLDAALAALAEQQGQQHLADLVGATWQWATELRPSGEMAPVEQPGAYRVTFAEDGTLAIQADCNQVAGAYELGAAGAIAITVGSSTLAACPGDSRSEAFVQLLSSATSFEFEQGQLVLLLNPQSGALGMIFEKTE